MIQSQEGLWPGAGALAWPGLGQPRKPARRRRCRILPASGGSGPALGPADSLTEVRESGEGEARTSWESQRGMVFLAKGAALQGPRLGWEAFWEHCGSTPSRPREHSQAGWGALGLLGKSPLCKVSPSGRAEFWPPRPGALSLGGTWYCSGESLVPTVFRCRHPLIHSDPMHP